VSTLLVAASLLACPDPAAFVPEERYAVIERYLDRLASLSRLRSNCAFVRFWRDETLLVALHQENAYPFRHSLAAAFAYLPPETEFQLEDANVLATAILDRSRVLENEGEISDLLISDASLLPPLAGDRPTAFVDQLFRMLALALPIHGDGDKLSPNVSVAMRSAEPPAMTVSFKIDMVEEGDGTCRECSEKKKFEVRAYVDADSMIKQTDVLELWRSSALHAESIAVQASRDDAQPADTYYRLRSTFHLGSDFASSAHDLGFLHDPKKISRLLRACADLLLSRNLADSHWLRTGMGPNDPQRMRGEWAAWRHDIDHEFHLHYWRAGGHIEFANVVTHKNLSIT
jgi:hypothetical protein